MRRSLLLACAAGLILASHAAANTPVASVPAAVQSVDVAAILASPVRTDADRERDAARRTADTVAFTGVQPGWKVADMIIGGGYFTRIFSAAVGPEGHVTAWQPEEFVAFQASYGEAVTAADALPNVDGTRSPIGAPVFGSDLDLIFTAQNYHDLHLRPFAADTADKVNAAAFAALKPGGYYVVIDHEAVEGSDLSVAHTLHRIDRDAAIMEVLKAGFVLEGISVELTNPDDPRTASVFDPSIRGRTSQFMVRFRKPL